MIITVVGPTATGKSDLGLALAEKFDGEVINGDAMQFYRGMDIGTAKLPLDQRRGISHHLLDVLDPTEEASVATYQEQARNQILELHSRGKTAVLVGGSGLYVRAVIDLLEFPGTDPALRTELEQRAATEGLASLFAELQLRDPKSAAVIDPLNERRVVRALEVVLLTGQSFTATMPQYKYWRPAVQIGLDCDRDELRARMTQRVTGMWEQGLVSEVEQLQTHGFGRTAARAVGYAETLRHLAGELTAEQCQEQIATNTHKLARRQRTWFRRDPRVQWLDALDSGLTQSAIQAVSEYQAAAGVK